MSDMSDQSERPRRPRANADELSAPFFDACERGVLTIQTCRSCRAHQLGAYRCWNCASKDLEWQAAIGTGTVYSFTLVHKSAHPFFATQAPYVATVVELTEGPRIYAPFHGDITVDIKVGAACTIKFIGEDGHLFPFCTLDKVR